MTSCPHGYGKPEHCDRCVMRMRDIGMAMRELRCGARVRRESWKHHQWAEAWLIAVNWTPVGVLPVSPDFGNHGQPATFIALSKPDGTLAPWSPTHEDLLACDWTAVS